MSSALGPLLLLLAQPGPIRFEGNVLHLAEAFPRARLENTLPRRGSYVLASAAGGACELVGRKGILLHPPPPPEEARAVFDLEFPDLARDEALQLRFFVGIDRATDVPDGVRFTVRAGAEELWSLVWGRVDPRARDPGETAWRPAGLNLTRWAGRRLELSLSTHCVETTTGDIAVWGEPRIVRLRRAGDVLEPLPEVRLLSFGADRAAPVAGEPFLLRARLHNAGDGRWSEAHAALRLVATPGLRLHDGAEREVPVLEPGAGATVAWRVEAATAAIHEVRLSGALTGSASVEVQGAARPGDPRVAVAGLEAVLAGDRRGFSRIEWLGPGGGRVAVSAPLGRVVVRLRAGAEEELLLHPTAAREIDGALECDGSTVDRDGALWCFRHTVRPVEAGVLRWRQTLRPDADREVLLWEGPVLLAGDGEPDGARKEGALFPGLDLLGPDEPSSSERNVAFPASIRHTPHPRRVTVPLLAVLRRGLLAGIAWDPRPAGEGPDASPCATFASPNFLDAQENHRLALSLPAARGRLREENAGRAGEPLRWPRGVERRIEVEVFVRPAREVAEAVPWWIRRHGVPPPTRTVREARDGLARSLAFFDARWRPAEEGWTLPGSDGPVHLRTAAMHEALAAELRPEPERTERLRRAGGVMERILTGRGRSDAAWEWTLNQNAHFILGGLLRARLFWGRGPEAFDPAPFFTWNRGPVTPWERWRELGATGEEAVGLGAAMALDHLSRARVTGEPRNARAGIEALRWMERYRWPSGAQSWEVPLRAPDALSAALAASAYLEGHALTGERLWLERAVEWADRGLPFIYLWGDPEVRAMRYGAVPALAASYYGTHPWFGTPVAWVGLALARALLRLSAAPGASGIEGALPARTWERIAEGLTAFALDVQEGEGPCRGGLPDGYLVVEQEPTTWPIVPPGPLLSMLLAFQGRDPDRPTRIVEGPAGRVHITSSADVRDARWSGDTLVVEIAGEPGVPVRTLLGGLPDPARVRVDGRPLARVEDLDQVLEGWQHLAHVASLFVAFPHPGGRVPVAVGGRPSR